LCRLGRLANSITDGDSLDDTNSNSLSHISDGESSKGLVLGKWLDAHWLGGDHLDNGSVTRLDLGGVVFNLLTGSSVNLFEELVESAGDVRGMAIEDWGVSLLDFTRVVEDDDLSVKGLGLLGGVVLAIRSNVTTSDVLDGDVLDVETNVITRLATLSKLLMVHLNRLDFSSDVSGGKGDNHTGLDGTSLDSSYGHSSDTSNLVNVLEGKSERKVLWSLGWGDGIEGFQEGKSAGLSSGRGVLAPTLVPGHVLGGFDHVITVPARDGYEWYALGVVTNLLDVVADFLDDFFKSVLGVLGLGVVHLVDSDDELFNSERESEESVLTGLAVLSDTGFKFTNTGGDNKYGAISL